MAMHVIAPGPRTTIQDKGRLGYQNSGFAPSGFIDRVASRMANALVDNEDGEAVVEFCLIGPTLYFDETVNLAVCGGDFSIDVDGEAIAGDFAFESDAAQSRNDFLASSPMLEKICFNMSICISLFMPIL